MALWSLKGKKILIIDDLSEMRSMLRGLLQSYAADDISQAGNGDDAVEMLGRQTFDIVLCDYNLGEGKDGQQVLEEARFRGWLPYSTIFIMVTAENTVFMVMGALEHMPDDYLSKPITRTVLHARLKRLMEKKEGLKTLSHALNNHDYDRAIRLCDEQIEKNPRNRMEMLKLKCDLLIKLEDLDRAMQLCQTVLAEREIPWAAFALGKIHFLRGDYAQAKTQLESIISANAAFVAAYDWLAKTLQALNDTQSAQQTLTTAIEHSPKSLQRQRQLAQVAEQNHDYSVAERARKRAIKVGRNSVARDVSDFTLLAETQLATQNGKEALRTLDNIKHEFKHDNLARLAAAVSRSTVYQALGDEEKSMQAAQEAVALFHKEPQAVPIETALKLTQTCLNHQLGPEADELVRQITHNHHEDQKLLEDVEQLYKQSGAGERAENLINATRREVIGINNRGVKFLEAGRGQEALELFESALADAPQNDILNINAAYACIVQLQKGATDPALFDKAKHYLDKSAANPSLRQRHRALTTRLFEIDLSKQR